MEIKDDILKNKNNFLNNFFIFLTRKGLSNVTTHL